jgi:hypothetical protein
MKHAARSKTRRIVPYFSSSTAGERLAVRLQSTCNRTTGVGQWTPDQVLLVGPSAGKIVTTSKTWTRASSHGEGSSRLHLRGLPMHHENRTPASQLAMWFVIYLFIFIFIDIGTPTRCSLDTILKAGRGLEPPPARSYLASLATGLTCPPGNVVRLRIESIRFKTLSYPFARG